MSELLLNLPGKISHALHKVIGLINKDAKLFDIFLKPRTLSYTPPNKLMTLLLSKNIPLLSRKVMPSRKGSTRSCPALVSLPIFQSPRVWPGEPHSLLSAGLISYQGGSFPFSREAYLSQRRLCRQWNLVTQSGEVVTSPDTTTCLRLSIISKVWLRKETGAGQHIAAPPGFPEAPILYPSLPITFHVSLPPPPQYLAHGRKQFALYLHLHRPDSSASL